VKLGRLRSWVRDRAPKSLRVRLTLLYASLFLVAGVALLGLTYGLVAGSLPGSTSSRLTANQQAKAVLACKSVELHGTSPKSAKAPQPKAVPARCTQVFRAGVTEATTSQRNQTLHNLLLFFLLGLAVTTIGAGALGWVMAGRVLQPLRAITGAARRASHEHLGERLSLEGRNDELKELAHTFDEMLDRLDAAFASQRRFVADASHELRTPLTVMRTAIDVTLAKPSRTPAQLEAMAGKVRRSLDQAESLIDALLTLASTEARQSKDEFVDLATSAEDAIDTVEADVSRMGLRVFADLEPAETTGDHVLLERMVANLVENAVRHNRSGGWIEVRTGLSSDAAFVGVANSVRRSPKRSSRSCSSPSTEETSVR
jgi:signal transduction histidine kinase